MRVATTYPEAFAFFTEARRRVIPLAGGHPLKCGVDIGKQFGTRIVFTMELAMGEHLLHELQKRDLPCPQVFATPKLILIGVSPE